MITKVKDYATLDLDDDHADFRYKFRDNMIAQYKQDLYNKSFSYQDQDKRDENFQKRIKFWLNYVVIMGGPKTEKVYV